jgi:hypothetical protein
MTEHEQFLGSTAPTFGNSDSFIIRLSEEHIFSEVFFNFPMKNEERMTEWNDCIDMVVCLLYKCDMNAS